MAPLQFRPGGIIGQHRAFLQSILLLSPSNQFYRILNQIIPPPHIHIHVSTGPSLTLSLSPRFSEFYQYFSEIYHWKMMNLIGNYMKYSDIYFNGIALITFLIRYSVLVLQSFCFLVGVF